MGILLSLALVGRAERLPIRTYSTADGLPHNVINKIFRDSRGFLWFCTQEGLARFDGYSFHSYGTDQGLPHTSVNDILETRAGEFWVATNGGLVHFNPKGVPAGRVVTANDAGPERFAARKSLKIPPKDLQNFSRRLSESKSIRFMSLASFV